MQRFSLSADFVFVLGFSAVILTLEKHSTESRCALPLSSVYGIFLVMGTLLVCLVTNCSRVPEIMSYNWQVANAFQTKKCLHGKKSVEQISSNFSVHVENRFLVANICNNFSLVTVHSQHLEVFGLTCFSPVIISVFIAIYKKNILDFFFLFQATQTGEMQLLENEFSSTLTDFIDSFLRRQDSIPAFLSSVTLDLYSRQTMVG